MRRGISRPAVLKAMRDDATPPLFVPEERAPLGLRRPPAADRPPPDHLAALHRRFHDRAARPASPPIAYSKSAPARATRRPSCRSWQLKGLQHRDYRRAGQTEATRAPQGAWATPMSSVRSGDGYQGWPEQAPFDRIILTAAPPELPPALLAQLKNGRPTGGPGRPRRAGSGRRGQRRRWQTATNVSNTRSCSCRWCRGADQFHSRITFTRI